MDMVSNVLKKEILSWLILVGICTDGVPSILGSRSEFMTLVKTKNPDIITTYYLIYRDVLASITLPAPLRARLNTVVHIVNNIEEGTLNTRLFRRLRQDIGSAHQDLLLCIISRRGHTLYVLWLSISYVLACVFEFFDEFQIFLAAQEKKMDQLSNDIQAPFKCRLVCLVYVFEASSELSWRIEGLDTRVIMHIDAIDTFLNKLALWK